MNNLDKVKNLDLTKDDFTCVINKYVDMLYNNITMNSNIIYKNNTINSNVNNITDNDIAEHFFDWCEGGNVFYNDFENIKGNEETILKRIEFMKIFCEYTDNLSDFLLGVYNNIG